MIDETISHYKILERLGEGGMGVVYKAEDTKLKRPVAIKFFSPQTLGTGEEKARFILEARAAASLDHPNICTVHEIDEVEGKTFIVMAYIDGFNLHETLEMGLLNVDDALDTAIQVAEGLQHAHEKGIVHRDIKLSNIMITGRGQAKITDFGLAKLLGHTSITQTGTILGTVDYMSPEQARGEPVDHRTDIWSLGVVLYMTLTAELPFKGATSQAVIYSIMNEDPAQMAHWQPAVPVSLEQAVQKMMHKDPLKRYEDMAALIKDLKSIGKDPAAVLVSVELAGPLITRRTPFVGRESERKELRRYLNRAKSGNGALVMLGGEPGVGKTRLCEELATEARRHGFFTLTGHCYQMEGSSPYIPFIEIIETVARIVKPDALLSTLGDSAPEVAKLMPELRRKFPDIPEPAEIPPEQERRHMFNGLRDFMERASRVQPMLLIMEDFQWADEATLRLLLHIAQHLREMPVFIVGTYRDTELDVAVSLARCLEELVRQRLGYPITLKSFPQTDVMAMLQGRTGEEPPAPFAQAVFEETEGNPFFVEELFKHLAEKGKLFDAEGHWRSDLRIDELEVPESVRLVVSHRLERVSRDCLRALAAASIIGRGFSFELLQELVDLDEDGLLDVIDAAERAQFISSTTAGGEIRFTFCHDLVRQTLVGSFSLPRRQRMHLRVVDAMEKVYANALEERAAAMAYHLSEAGTVADPIKAIHWLTLAGDRALSASAFEDALRLFENAISLQVVDETRGPVELLYKRGLALRSMGCWEEALADWQQVLSAYEEVGDVMALGRICYDISEQFVWRGRLTEALETGGRGLVALGDLVNVERCRLLGGGGRTLSFAGRHSEGEGMLAQAADMARQLGDQRLLGEILAHKTWHHWAYMQSKEAIDASKQATELLRSASDLWALSDVLWVTQQALLHLGRWDDLRRIGEELEPLAARLGHLGALILAKVARGDREMALNADIDSYEESAKECMKIGRELGWPWFSLFQAQLGKAQFWRGRWEEARRNFQEAAKMEPPGVWAGANWPSLFLLEAYVGDKDAAIAMLQEKMDNLPQAGTANTNGAWAMLMGIIEGLAVLGESDETTKLYPLALEAIGTGNKIRPFRDGLIQTAAGIAAAASGQWDKAEEHYRIALCQAHEIPHKIEQPEVRRWYARMLIERNGPGDKEKARTLLTEAIEMYHDIGMPKHLEMAEELLGGL